MNELEYDRQMKEIKDDYLSKCKKLRWDFVSSNTTVSNDDIVTDHIGSIVVERAGVYLETHGTGYPKLRVFGLCLKKDGGPRKDKSKRWIFAQNVKSVVSKGS